VTERRTPRASSLTLVTDTGERVVLSGRRAEILAYLAAELVARDRLEALEVWSLELHVTQAKILCRLSETGVPWRFRTEQTA